MSLEAYKKFESKKADLNNDPYAEARLSKCGNTAAAASSEQAAQDLQRTGLLPHLVLNQATRLDRNHDGQISRQELQETIDRAKTEDRMTVLAARHALKNFDQIERSNDTPVLSWLARGFRRQDALSTDEVREYARNAPAQPVEQIKSRPSA